MSGITQSDIDNGYRFGEWVKFYKSHKPLTQHNLAKAFDIIRLANLDKQPATVNDAVEWYNILLYIEAGLYLYCWGEIQKQEFASYGEAITDALDTYFGDLDQDACRKLFDEVNELYFNDLKVVLGKYGAD